MSKRPIKPNAIKRRQLRAFVDGQESAIRKAVPEIERRYRVHALVRFWVALYAAFGLGLAMGAALYEAWLAAGL